MRGVPDGGNVLEREPLLAALETAAQRVDSTGLAAAALLCGEPGIGKSTLLDMTTASLVERWTVLRITGRALGSERPYDAARPLMRRLQTLLGEEGVAAEEADALERTAVALTRVAARSPVALVVDDLHWVDARTIDLLDYLWTEFSSAPVLWMVALRRPEAESRAEVGHFLHRLERDRRSLVLDVPRLTLLAVTAMCSAAGEAAPALADGIFERSRGNPLVVDALLRAPASVGSTDVGPHPIPSYVREVFAGQLRDLVVAERDLVCAVAARDAPLADEEAVSVLARVGHGAETTRAAVRALLTRGLLERPQAALLAIGHPVVGELALDQFADDALGQVCAAVLVTCREALAPFDAARLAETAGDALDPTIAVDVLTAAADRVLGETSVDFALRWQREAVRQAERIVGAEGKATQVRSLLRLVGHLDGTPSEALGVAARALQVADGTDDPEAVVEAALAVARARWRTGQDIVADLRRLVELGDRGGSGLGLTARVRAYRLAVVAELDEQLLATMAEDCQRRAADAGRPEAATAVRLLSWMRQMHAFGADEWHRLQATLDGDTSGLPAELVAILRLEQANLLGDLAGLEQLVTDPALPSWRRVLGRFESAFLSGRWDDAQRIVDSMGPLGRHSETRDLGRWLQVHRGSMPVGAEGPADVLAAYSALLHLQAFEMPSVGVDDPYLAMQEARVRPLIAELQLTAGRVAEFERTFARIDAMAVEGTRMHGVVTRLLGLRARAQGDVVGAVQHLRSAASIHRGCGLLFEACRCELEALTCSPTPLDEAQLTRLGELAAWFDDIGAAPWVRQARACLEAQPAGRHAPTRALLTRREMEIAGLVAQGLSNAQIAAELYLSVRTVTSHLDHAYTKLGVGSRAALAVYVRELDRNT